MSNYEVSYAGSKIKAIIIGIIVVITLAIILSASVKIVDAGHRGVLLHWQDVDGLILEGDKWVAVRPPLGEGLHFVVPIQDDVVNVEVRTQKFTKSSTSASKDLQNVSTEITVNYHPTPNSVHVLYRTVGLDYSNRIIQPAVDETVKQITANYNAEELITQRPQVKADIEQALRQRLLDFNIVQDVVSITDFQFSSEFSNAIEAKVTADQRALEQQNIVKIKEAEARQAEAIAHGIRLAAIEEAEGKKEAAILVAEGNARAIEIEANATKTRIQLVTEYLRNNPDFIEYLRILQWNGIMPETLVTDGDQANLLLQIPNRVTQQISVTNP